MVPLDGQAHAALSHAGEEARDPKCSASKPSLDGDVASTRVSPKRRWRKATAEREYAGLGDRNVSTGPGPAAPARGRDAAERERAAGPRFRTGTSRHMLLHPFIVNDGGA